MAGLWVASVLASTSEAIEIHVEGAAPGRLFPERIGRLLAPTAHEIIQIQPGKSRIDHGRIRPVDRAVGGLNEAEPLIAPSHGLGR